MDLHEIDVWGLETSERQVGGIEDCSTRQVRLVNILGQLLREGKIICDKAMALRGDYDLGARIVVLFDELGDDAL